MDNPEYLYTFAPLAMWSTVEIGVGLTASSLATLMPLFRKIKIFARSASQPSTEGTGPPQFQERRPRHALPSSLPDQGGAPRWVSDVEALKRQPSDEMELYRFGRS